MAGLLMRLPPLLLLPLLRRKRNLFQPPNKPHNHNKNHNRNQSNRNNNPYLKGKTDYDPPLFTP